MKGSIRIGRKIIGRGRRTYCIAELSANHNRKFKDAVSLIHAAKDAGADAVKLQTYTPDTLTIACDNDCFFAGTGTLWEGKNLYELYSEAYTPWEWQPELKEIANNLGMDLFSTPFDHTAADFLEGMDVPAYKIASFELVDLPLIEYVAGLNKPIILSTGMATIEEIDDAVAAIRNAGNNQIALLKCTSAYPATAEDMNLLTIPDMMRRYHVPVGLSDHTLGSVVPTAAVALGACIIEKHLALSRQIPGPDSAFSLEPGEFSDMVRAVRITEKAIGRIRYGVLEHERQNVLFRRSLFVVKDMEAGEEFTDKNVRSIRPGTGLPPKEIRSILGRRAKTGIRRGTPLSYDLVEL
jgi:N-acetylneuraminate synthase